MALFQKHESLFFFGQKKKKDKLLNIRVYPKISRLHKDIWSYFEDSSHDLKFSYLIFLMRESMQEYLNFSIFDISERQVANLLLKDVSGVNYIWNQAKGYPSKGQRTHGNAKIARKVRLIFFHRILQMIKLFGRRKRNIYPTLVQAEYINRLWKNNWCAEWQEAQLFVEMHVAISGERAPFNPVLLSKAQTNGYTRTGAASKLGKSKKITKVFTIGVPVFFSQWIYLDPLPDGFPVRLHIGDELRKQMGKKQNKKKQKLSINFSSC